MTSALIDDAYFTLMKQVQMVGEHVNNKGTDQRAYLCQNAEPEQTAMARFAAEVVAE